MRARGCEVVVKAQHLNTSELVFKVFVLDSMFSFESFVFTMLLLSSAKAAKTLLRSSVSDWSRRLSFQDIASYAPQMLSTDHVSHNRCWVRVGLSALPPCKLYFASNNPYPNVLYI
jgi:hypothetical protein